jgi:hypothetical protein
MRTVRAGVAAAALACVLCLAPRASAADPAAARDQLKLGWQLAQDGKCAEAIPHLVESLRLDPKAITLINLAQCEEKVGHLADALGHWIDARSRAQVEGNTAIELEAEKRARALEPRLPRLTINLSKDAPKGAEVSRDGVVLGGPSLGVAASVNPGEHVIVVKAPGRKDAKYDVALAESETKTVQVDAGEVDASAKPERKEEPRPVEEVRGGTSPLVFIGFGVAAAGLGIGTVTGLMALDKAQTAKRECPDLACPEPSKLDDVESGRTLGTISTVAFVAGGIGAAVGFYGLFAGGKRSDPQATGKAARVFVGPTGGGIRGSF